jgi:cation diffusion facilitator family transporter
MHIHNLARWQHPHKFVADEAENEKKTLRVVLLTAFMMVIEIIAGLAFGSMALLADGWHMGTHAAALGIALFAYRYARRHADNPKYTFGTGKVSVLGGFTSAVVLLLVALLMMVESLERFWNPVEIQFNEAIVVAVIGLVVNLVSVYMLGDHHHDHDHDHHHDDHDHEHTDHNIRAAYLHVLADALTSVTAILALIVGRAFGWIWMDALMGIVGGLVISRWALGLLKETSHILLDGSTGDRISEKVRELIEGDTDNRVVDLHIWKITPRDFAAIISIVTHYPQPIQHYRDLLDDLEELKHVTVELNICEEAPCLPVEQTLAVN